MIPNRWNLLSGLSFWLMVSRRFRGDNFPRELNEGTATADDFAAKSGRRLAQMLLIRVAARSQGILGAHLCTGLRPKSLPLYSGEAKRLTPCPLSYSCSFSLFLSFVLSLFLSFSSLLSFSLSFSFLQFLSVSFSFFLCEPLVVVSFFFFFFLFYHHHQRVRALAPPAAPGKKDKNVFEGFSSVLCEVSSTNFTFQSWQIFFFFLLLLVRLMYFSLVFLLSFFCV